MATVAVVIDRSRQQRTIPLPAHRKLVDQFSQETDQRLAAHHYGTATSLPITAAATHRHYEKLRQRYPERR